MQKDLRSEIDSLIIELMAKELSLLSIRESVLAKYRKVKNRSEIIKYVDNQLKKEAALYIQNPEIWFADQLRLCTQALTDAVKGKHGQSVAQLLIVRQRLLQGIVSEGTDTQNFENNTDTKNDRIVHAFQAFTGEVQKIEPGSQLSFGQQTEVAKTDDIEVEYVEVEVKKVG